MANIAGKPNAKLRALGMIALFAPLFAILAAALWFATRAFTEISGPPMPIGGYIAMTLGVVFSILVGSGLMALLFYSSRHGYDEQRYGEPSRTENDGD
jgi:hypothetical protein